MDGGVELKRRAAEADVNAELLNSADDEKRVSQLLPGLACFVLGRKAVDFGRGPVPDGIGFFAQFEFHGWKAGYRDIQRRAFVGLEGREELEAIMGAVGHQISLVKVCERSVLTPGAAGSGAAIRISVFGASNELGKNRNPSEDWRGIFVHKFG